MQISLNWLSTLVPKNSLPDINTISSKLTSLGLEVENVKHKNINLKNVKVGKITSCQNHPNANKLKLCSVDVNEKKELSIICGAKNVRKGILVAVATLGAELSLSTGKKMTILKRNIRGIPSEGMICSEEELGISSKNDEILILDGSCNIGEDFSEIIKEDTIFDIAVTPNRADALSHRGIARELVGAKKICSPLTELLHFQKANLSQLKINVSGNPSPCPYYTATIIKNIKVDTSPFWLQEKIRSIGGNPINNVVDVTNYVLHHLGQPIHVFDLDKLSGGKIIVQNNLKYVFEALDNEKYNVQEGTVMICDNEKPVAIGGIIGGAESSVSDTTKNILIESAYFLPSSIRKSSKKISLSTNASYFFERGVDINTVQEASSLACKLILDIAGGSLSKCYSNSYKFSNKKEITLRYSYLSKMLGVNIDPVTIKEILQFIGCDILSESSRNIILQVPTYRLDVNDEIDVVEEVARLYGYDNIPESSRLLSSFPLVSNTKNIFEETLRQVVLGAGFTEVITSSLISEKDIHNNKNLAIKTANAISQDFTTLRTSLLPGFLKVISHNTNRGSSHASFFELGRTYIKTLNNKEVNYLERNCLGLALMGGENPLHWEQKQKQVDVFTMKGAIENIILSIYPKSRVLYKPIKELKLRISVVALTDKRSIFFNLGTLEKISYKHTNVLYSYNNFFYAELDVDILEKISAIPITVEKPSKYPVVVRDLAFYVSKNTQAQDVISVIYSACWDVVDVTLFDVYSSTSEKKSLAFRLKIENKEGTLKQGDIKKTLNKITEAVLIAFNANLRSL